jgi:anti-anti-sigma regulatory factor
MTIVINGEQTVRTVGDLRERLLEALAPGAATILDIEEVSEADLAFVQLVESARRHAAAVGADLGLTASAPASVREVLDRAGFPDADCPFWNQGVPTT